MLFDILRFPYLLLTNITKGSGKDFSERMEIEYLRQYPCGKYYTGI